MGKVLSPVTVRAKCNIVINFNKFKGVFSYKFVMRNTSYCQILLVTQLLKFFTYLNPGFWFSLIEKYNEITSEKAEKVTVYKH